MEGADVVTDVDATIGPVRDDVTTTGGVAEAHDVTVVDVAAGDEVVTTGDPVIDGCGGVTAGDVSVVADSTLFDSGVLLFFL